MKESRKIKSVEFPAKLRWANQLKAPLYESLCRSKKGNNRVMLIIPPYNRFPDKEMKRASEPLGLLRIGSELVARGWNVKIIDAPCEGFDNEVSINGGQVRFGLSFDELNKKIWDFDPAFVGISCLYTKQWRNARRLADIVKSVDPERIVILGGSHPTGDYRNSLADSPADYIVFGEGELTICELLDALYNKEDIDKVRGIAYRTDSESDGIRVTKSRSFTEINSFVLNNRTLLNSRIYNRLMHTAGSRRSSKGDMAYVMTTKGCRQSCTFCLASLVQGGYREYSLRRVDGELMDLRRHGVNYIMLEDDNLIHNMGRAIAIAQLLGSHKFRWVEEGGLALFKLLSEYKTGATKKLIRTFADNGCERIYLAVESANVRRLSESKKPDCNAKQRKEAFEIVERFAEKGISVVGGFMLGFVHGSDHEKKEEIEETIQYAIEFMKRGMDFANFFIVTPFPGTRDYSLQLPWIVRDYDYFSHEIPVMGGPEWTVEEMENIYAEARRKVNGDELIDEILRTRNWVCRSDLK